MRIVNFTDLDESDVEHLELYADLLSDDERDAYEALADLLFDEDVSGDDADDLIYLDTENACLRLDDADDLPGTLLLMRCYMEDR